MNKALKKFAELLGEQKVVIANEEEVLTAPSEGYQLAKTIYKNREVLVPLLCRMAIGINKKERPICHALELQGEMMLVKQFVKNIVGQFLDNLKEKKYVAKWTVNDANQYEIEATDTPERQRFLRSGWAEQVFRHIIMKTVQSFCASHQLSAKAFQNVELKQDGCANLLTELDLVVQVRDRFYVFEIKSGPWIRIMQWAKRENLLQGRNVRVVVCTVHENIPAYIFEPQILMNLNSIEDGLETMLKEDFHVGG